MKKFIILLSFIGSSISQAQSVISHIEGVLQLYHNLDSTSIFLGNNNAPSFNVSGQNHNNILMGSKAGYQLVGGYNNLIIGPHAGSNLSYARGNVMIGPGAGLLTKNINLASNNGHYNTYLGFRAGHRNATGFDNVNIGYESGYFQEYGNGNVNIGVHTTMKEGNYNTLIGQGAGGPNYKGNYNILLGPNTGPNTTGIGTINISNKMYIDIEKTDEPLIYGEFDNDLIRINGDFETAGYVKVNSFETSSAPDCSSSEHLGRIYYDKNRNRMRVCTMLNGREASFQGWKDMHDNTPD